jgi:hypothetical protein
MSEMLWTMAEANPAAAFPRAAYLDVAPRKAAADEIAGYDAVLFGECATAAQSINLQTLARIFDVDPTGLSPGSIWARIRPLVMQ